MFANFIGYLFVAQICYGTISRMLQCRANFPSVSGLPVGNRQHRHLNRRQPKRQCARVMFDQDPDEAFQRSDDRAVKHHRNLARVVLRDVFSTEAFGHRKIHLHRAALPRAAERIAQAVVDLRAVERTVTRQVGPFHAAGVQRRAQRPFGAVPDFVGADPLVRTQ